MTLKGKSRSAFWMSVSVFFIMLAASFILPELFDLTQHEGFTKFYNLYNLSTHACILILLKAARLAVNEERLVPIIDIFITLMWGDVIDRILGTTTFEIKDVYILGFVVLMYFIKHRKNFAQWLQRNKR